MTDIGLSASANIADDVLELFERHGLHYRDERHTGCAMELVRDAALIYDGQLDPLAARTEVGSCLTSMQLQLLAEMCEDARACVTAGIETCRYCDNGICREHSRALDRAESYRIIARQLGAQPVP